MPMRTTLPSEPLGSMRTSLAPSIGLKDLADRLGLGISFDDLLPNGRELFGGDNRRGVFTTFDLALVGALEGGANGDDPARTQHLQLQIGVARDGHEIRVAWTS